MNCGQVKPILGDYFSGRLDEQKKKELEEHLRYCNTCLVDFNRMKLYFEKLANLSSVIPSPKSLFDEIIKLIQDDSAPAQADSPKTTKSTKTTKSGAMTEAQKRKTITAELSKVETVQRKQKPPAPKKKKNDNLFVYVAVALVILLLVFYLFIKFYKK